LKKATFYFLCVGTPSDKEGAIDLSYIKDASLMLGHSLRNHSNEYSVVVVKSTVTPGTTLGIVKPVIEAASKIRFGEELGLAMNPEFLIEGSALQDMMHPDRLVIGEFDNKSGEAVMKLYERLYAGRSPSIIRTSTVNAEFIKYASNAFLATKISFINTIANIAQRVPGADVKIIAQGMGLDKRIGEKFLNAGVGYGGSCFPKDVRAFTHFSKKLGAGSELFSTVDKINIQQATKVVEYAASLAGNLRGKKVTLLGLAFKPDTDDIREAPSVRIIRELMDQGVGTISVYDPKAKGNIRQIFGDKLVYCDSSSDAISGADLCILVTEWEEFKKLKPEDFKTFMRTPVVIDGRRIFDPALFPKTMIFGAVGLGA